jgi:hypothetical protein
MVGGYGGSALAKVLYEHRSEIKIPVREFRQNVDRFTASTSHFVSSVAGISAAVLPAYNASRG